MSCEEEVDASDKESSEPLEEMNELSFIREIPPMQFEERKGEAQGKTIEDFQELHDSPALTPTLPMTSLA